MTAAQQAEFRRRLEKDLSGRRDSSYCLGWDFGLAHAADLLNEVLWGPPDPAQHQAWAVKP